MQPLVSFADFTAAFPEFAEASEAAFTLWEAEAERELSASRFGDSLPLAVMLFVAHNLSLNARTTRASASGGDTSSAFAAVSSKSVGSVSKSYDNGIATYQGAGEWNASPYGLRLYRMLQAYNVGPFYVPHPHPLPRAGRYGFGRF